MHHQERDPECPKANPTTAFYFDVASIILQDTADTVDTLRMLQSKKIPFVFLANGMTEMEHVEPLPRQLDVGGPLEEQFVIVGKPTEADLSTLSKNCRTGRERLMERRLTLCTVHNWR